MKNAINTMFATINTNYTNIRKACNNNFTFVDSSDTTYLYSISKKDIFVDFNSKKIIKLRVVHSDTDSNEVESLHLLIDNKLIGRIMIDGIHSSDTPRLYKEGIFQFPIETIITMINNKDIYISPTV